MQPLDYSLLWRLAERLFAAQGKRFAENPGLSCLSNVGREGFGDAAEHAMLCAAKVPPGSLVGFGRAALRAGDKDEGWTSCFANIWITCA